MATLGVAMIFAGHARAEDPRIAPLSRAYVERCSPELSSQGMTPQKAGAICTCTVAGIVAEINFGVAGDRERYERIINAQPDPNGSAEDQRLHKILTDCFVGR